MTLKRHQKFRLELEKNGPKNGLNSLLRKIIGIGARFQKILMFQ